MRVWFDVEDLFEYARLVSRPSGIQRLSYELYSALYRMAPSSVGFVRHDAPSHTMRITDWSEVETLYGKMVNAAVPQNSQVRHAVTGSSTLGPFSQMPGLRQIAARLPSEVRGPLGQSARAQINAFRNLGAAFRAVPRAFGRPAVTPLQPVGIASNLPKSVDLRDVISSGDVLASFGSPWAFAEYANLISRMIQGSGARFSMLVYDLIPAVRPEFCDRGLVTLFNKFMQSCLPLVDIPLAISEATVRDMVYWAAKQDMSLRATPRAIPIGTGFGSATPTVNVPQGLESGGYVLFVSTVEARKNHVLAFRAWRRLLDEIGPERLPTLVFAGRVGWMVADLMQQIENANWLDGKIILIQEPDDATLASLYHGAKFTMFPSLYEGWGLPVSESLAFGKVCLASSSSSVPEAGGPFCLYHDPDNVTEAVLLFRRAIIEPHLIADLEAKISAEYRPTPWSATANAVMNALQ